MPFCNVIGQIHVGSTKSVQPVATMRCDFINPIPIQAVDIGVTPLVPASIIVRSHSPLLGADNQNHIWLSRQERPYWMLPGVAGISCAYTGHDKHTSKVSSLINSLLHKEIMKDSLTY